MRRASSSRCCVRPQLRSRRKSMRERARLGGPRRRETRPASPLRIGAPGGGSCQAGRKLACPGGAPRHFVPDRRRAFEARGKRLFRAARPRGAHIAYERTFNVPRLIATEEVLRATKLPGFWPPPYSDFSQFDRQSWHLSDDDDVVDARIVGRFVTFAGGTRPFRKRRWISAILRAQSGIAAEFNKALAAIRALLRLDAEIATADRRCSISGRGPVFDPAMLPTNLEAGRIIVASRCRRPAACAGGRVGISE